MQANGGRLRTFNRFESVIISGGENNMARTSNRGGGNRGGGNRSGGSRGGGNSSNRNNNPSGRNQYSGGMMDIARERPLAAAAVAVGAAATGLFMWSRRSQISNQLSNLSDQISEWSEGIGSSDDTDDTAGLTTSDSSGGTSSTSRRRGSSRKSQQQISEEALSLRQTGE
jgi:hypothetical protein